MNGDSKPFLTIAIPVFNGEGLLAPMLASLDSQDWSLFEVRFGDDGSTDGTRHVLDEFAAGHPGKVFVETHENIGEGFSRNRLLAQAAGEYLWFCDADDEIAPGCIARIAEILRDHPVDFLSFCYGAKPDDPGKARLDLAPVPVSQLELMLSMPCATWAKVMRTSRLRDEKISSPTTKLGDDLIFTILAACHSRSALFWYAKPYWVRRRPDSVSGKVDETFCSELRRSLVFIRGLIAGHPAFKNAIEVQLFDFWNYFLRRLRDDAPPEVRQRWMPVVKKEIADLVSAGDNPLLRIPRSFSLREGKALKREDEALKREHEALRREHEALKREREAKQGEKAALQREQIALEREHVVRSSLSWRVTAPLRALARAFCGSRRHT